VLQYQAARLPVVANPVGVQAEMIEPGLTGYLPDGDDDWVDAIRRLAADAPLRRSMGLLARRRVEEGFSVSAWAETFVAAVTGTERREKISSAGPEPPTRGIPVPFLVRLRRIGSLAHAEHAGHFDGPRDAD
jgi:hypothetical protein